MKRKNKMPKKKVSSAKSKVVSPIKRAKKRNSPARGVKRLQVEVLDRILLKMGQKPYKQLLSQIELGKKRLDEERQLALQIGHRILAKAKKVRDSLGLKQKSSR